MNGSDLRSKVDQLIAAGEALEASRELASLWKADPSSAAFVVSRFRAIGPNLALSGCKVAIERSFTMEPLVPVCRAAALVEGIDLTMQLGPFNAYAQEILDRGSSLYRFDPDVVFLAVLTSDVAPELWNGSRIASAASQSIVARVVDHFSRLIETFRARSNSHLVIHLLELPAYPNLGVLDSQVAEGQVAAVRQINEEIRRIAREQRGVYTLDYDRLIARFGHLNWRDEVKWQTVRMPIRAEYQRYLAHEWLKFLCPILGRIAKVVAIDLDNTIWGGIVGEDGLAGIKLGQEYPGVAYRSLQQALLELLDRGLLLAICSKNNLEDAMEVFDKHPDMVLKPQHFSAIRINWDEKSNNLRSIAAELNVGLEALALVDDNPVERQQVRRALPDVHVLELPEHAIQYADAVRDFPSFQRLILANEDRERRSFYAARQRVSELEAASETKEEFYRSLEQRVQIEPVTDMTLARFAQLTQKTNQFNVTTRRYTEQQISQILTRQEWRTYTIRVIDRYADNGLIGVALSRDSQNVCEIDTFLLSCRVIGRGVETALLSHLVQDARIRGIRIVRGRFIPSKKNEPAKEFFRNHGFRLTEDLPDTTVWELDVLNQDVAWPPWIQALNIETAAP